MIDEASVHELSTQRSSREQRVAASTAAALLGRAIALGLSIVTVPLAIGYLGTEAYGVLAALTSMASLLMLADLGLGNGLLNIASAARANDDRATLITTVSTAFFMLVATATVVGTVSLALVVFLDLGTLLNVQGRLAIEVGFAAAIFFGLVAIGIPLSVTERLRLAYQEGWVNSAAAVLGALLGLAGLLLAVWLQLSFPLLVLAVASGPILALALNAAHFFRRRDWMAPRPGRMNRLAGKRLITTGAMFFALQLSFAVTTQSDVIVAASVVGPEEAAIYAVTLRVAMFVPTLIAMYLFNLWPAYTEAIARGDMAWVSATLRRSILLAGGIASGAAIALVVFGDWVIRTWTGGAISTPSALLIGAALWVVLSATFNAVGTFLNAASVLRFQAVTAAITAPTSVVLSVIFARSYGISGIVFGTVIAYFVCTALPASVVLPRVLRRLSESPNQ